MENQQKPMEYVILPGTGLQVSRIGYGHMLTKDTPENQENTNKMIKECWDLGINFFDNAEYYGEGLGEIQFGKAFQALNVPREDAVITTQIFFSAQVPTNENGMGTSRKHVVEGLRKSLQRLGLDYVDLVYCHRFDEDTPVEQTVRAMNWVIENGMALYWGTSEWSAANIFEAFAICQQYQLIKPVVEQPQYSMFAREKIEKDYYRLFKYYKYGSTIWSPLCSGILTGQYNQGIPQDSRIKVYSVLEPGVKEVYDQHFGTQELAKKTLEKLNQIEAIGQEMGASMAQLAIAWTIKNQNVTVALTSSSRVGQITETVGSLVFVNQFTQEIDDQLDLILGNQPKSELNCRTFTPNPNTRDF